MDYPGFGENSKGLSSHAVMPRIVPCAIRTNSPPPHFPRKRVHSIRSPLLDCYLKCHSSLAYSKQTNICTSKMASEQTLNSPSFNTGVFTHILFMLRTVPCNLWFTDKSIGSNGQKRGTRAAAFAERDHLLYLCRVHRASGLCTDRLPSSSLSFPSVKHQRRSVVQQKISFCSRSTKFPRSGSQP